MITVLVHFLAISVSPVGGGRGVGSLMTDAPAAPEKSHAAVELRPGSSVEAPVLASAPIIGMALPIGPPRLPADGPSARVGLLPVEHDHSGGPGGLERRGDR